jgi:hypothetical protein
VRPLLREVVLHEGLLAATVPQVQRQVAQELDVGQVDVDGGAAGRGSVLQGGEGN